MSQLIVKVFMGLLGLVLIVFLVVALGIYIVWATLRWLLTGRKPKVVMVWQQFSTLRKNFGQGGFRRSTAPGFDASWGRGASSTANDQVVDVEVREVVEEAPRLPTK